MVCGIIITIYTLLLLVASLLYVKKRYSIEKGALTRTAQDSLAHLRFYVVFSHNALFG